MTDRELVDQTVEQMWTTFWRDANPNEPDRKAPIEAQVAYYAACHNMLAKMMAWLRLDKPASDEWKLLPQKWSDEITKFVDDYRSGKVEADIQTDTLSASADHFPELIAALTPEEVLEARARLDDGDIAFLPTQVKFEKGRIWFPGGIGWKQLELDPAAVPIFDIRLLYLVKIPAGYTLEVRFNSGWQPGMPMPPRH